MNSAEYLDLAIKSHELRNDSQLAIALKWNRQKVSNYRHLKQAMDNNAAREFADFMDIPVIKVIADMEIQREKDPNKKRAWSKLAKMTSSAGMASTNLLINMTLFSGATLYCILCKIADTPRTDILEVSPSFK